MDDSAPQPCALIPVYNHARKLPGIVQSLRQAGLPVLLVDDGSEPDCARVLDQLSALEGVSLIRLPQNSGKGVAVCRGLSEAMDAGFSHALQVDADGQHDLDDLPAFLQAMREHPGAVVSGRRSYSDMPPGRRRGRKFTDMWVCIHTLSRNIHDSMCGYRLYPLAATLALLQRHSVGRRMDFDTDILVRLYWQGLPVMHVDTRVRYGEDMESHFHMLRDNIRITRMHTRLFFGMLWRLPRLLRRRFLPYN